MAAREQERPFAPASHRIPFDRDDKAFSAEMRKHSHSKYVQCCGCIAALMLIQAVIILILVFTVFRIKDPVLKMNSVKIDGLDLSSQTSTKNLTVTADVSVKNRNVAAFKFSNATTTTIYYGGVAVGEGRSPAGVARARRTLRFNLTIDVMLAKVVGVERFGRDFSFGAMNISSYTRVGGRVKILGIIKKKVAVKMNCTMTVNITSQAIQDQNCRQSISI